MEADRFWNIIAEAREKTTSPHRIAEEVTKTLRGMTPPEIIDFEETLSGYLQEADRYDLYAVAYIIMNGCSGDGFMDFRGWLIAQGRDFFEQVLQDPRSIVGRVPERQDLRWEEMLYVAMTAYEEKTGDDMPKDVDTAAGRVGGPAGEEWEESDLPAMYPDLCQRYGVPGEGQ